MSEARLTTTRRDAVVPDERVGAVVEELCAVLHHAGVADARAEARDMLAAVLDVPRFWPSLHRDATVPADTRQAALACARRRAIGAPFAYAVGRAAFRHLTLAVDERVLIPRQETEQLVELVLARSGSGGIAVDVGTGSGAIALSLAAEGRFARVIATDISNDALSVARANAERLAPVLRAPVEFRHGSLLAPVAGVRARALVANPPYIAHAEAATLPASVRDWEPPLALYSENGGLAATAALVAGARCVLEPGGLLAIEIDSRRAGESAALARDHGFDRVAIERDLTGRERFLLAHAPGAAV